jgi:hypothetical protein
VANPSRNTTAVLSLCLALIAVTARAAPEDQDVFTDFEDIVQNTAVGEIINVGSSPDLASFSGDAFAGFIGVGQFYHSGVRSWMVTTNGTGVIDFETDAGVVEFWTTAHSAANGNTVITAFDALDIMVGPPVVITPGSGFQLVSFAGAIASIEVVNDASNQMNGIDDFGFTSVPEPSGPAMWFSGAVLLTLLRRRRTPR